MITPHDSAGPNTVIDFCCRSDGFAANPIYLPSTVPFVLYQSVKGVCQEVFGTKATKIWVKWDTEDDNNSSGKKGVVPFGVNYGNIELNYCHYTPNWFSEKDNGK